MANNGQPILSSKRLKINKASSVMVIAIAVSSFIVVFSLVASKSLLNQRSYQAKVISKKEKALNQLKTDISSSNDLLTAYKAFVSGGQNIIGGSPGGTGPNDGDNGKIILDALPSQYDFPALATSLNALLNNGKVKLTSIAGTDDEVNQQSQQTSSSTPQPIPMPFQVGISGSYSAIQDIISVMQRSIRPIQISTLNISGNDSSMNIAVQAQTYYQPAKSLSITSEVVR